MKLIRQSYITMPLQHYIVRWRISLKYFYAPSIEVSRSTSFIFMTTIHCKKTVSNDDSKKFTVESKTFDLPNITFTDKLMLSRHIIILSVTSFQHISKTILLRLCLLIIEGDKNKRKRRLPIHKTLATVYYQSGMLIYFIRIMHILTTLCFTSRFCCVKYVFYTIKIQYGILRLNANK